MVEFEEHVVKMFILVSGCLKLVEVRRNVAEIIKVLWPNLRNVQINQMTVVSIDFIELLFG
jgi:hypothetical protein